ncbi:MAG: hypothetical protein H7839_10850 [Magnetococcus sp. YQC-5]
MVIEWNNQKKGAINLEQWAMDVSRGASKLPCPFSILKKKVKDDLHAQFKQTIAKYLKKILLKENLFSENQIIQILPAGYHPHHSVENNFPMNGPIYKINIPCVELSNEITEKLIRFGNIQTKSLEIIFEIAFLIAKKDEHVNQLLYNTRISVTRGGVIDSQKNTEFEEIYSFCDDEILSVFSIFKDFQISVMHDIYKVILTAWDDITDCKTMESKVAKNWVGGIGYSVEDSNLLNDLVNNYWSSNTDFFIMLEKAQEEKNGLILEACLHVLSDLLKLTMQQLDPLKTIKTQPMTVLDYKNTFQSLLGKFVIEKEKGIIIDGEDHFAICLKFTKNAIKAALFITQCKQDLKDHHSNIPEENKKIIVKRIKSLSWEEQASLLPNGCTYVDLDDPTIQDYFLYDWYIACLIAARWANWKLD